jgi:hypothetical protein
MSRSKYNTYCWLWPVIIHFVLTPKANICLHVKQKNFGIPTLEVDLHHETMNCGYQGQPRTLQFQTFLVLRKLQNLDITSFGVVHHSPP